MPKGIYCLVIKLNNSQRIRIGALGGIAFGRGFYCYVGSAMGGLEKRIARHLRKRKKIRWHIDYLLEKASIVGVKEITTNKKLECGFGGKIEQIAYGKVKDFGSSDCKCKSHLYFFRENPFRQILKLNP